MVEPEGEDGGRITLPLTLRHAQDERGAAVFPSGVGLINTPRKYRHKRLGDRSTVLRVEQRALSSVRVAVGCLTGVILSLLLVGIVSGTLLPHVVQVVPALIALGILLRQPAIGTYAAVPIYAFWILVMVFIWLYLLGLLTVVEGSYTPVEIALTIAIASCSAWGLRQSLNIERPLSLLRPAATAVLFLALQVAFMAASFEL